MAKLGAGTLFKQSDMADPAVLILIPGVKSIGAIGEEAPLVETTALENTAKQYIAGIIDGEEKELTANYEEKSAEQKAFRDAAKAREQRDIEIHYPNGAVAKFKLLYLGFKMNEPETEAALTFTVKAKQIGETDWSEAS